MVTPHRALNCPHGECTVRVVWAAHILSYLKDNQNHEELHEAENNLECGSNIDESSDYETDYETDKNVIMSGPRNSVRQKFLDCIAQLLSPCKGWNGVTATAIREGEHGVEVDIARNDSFPSDEDSFGDETMGYCKMLEVYLAGSADTETGINTTATSLTEFELKAIDYTSRRIDHWIETLQKSLENVQNCPDFNSQQWLGQKDALEIWTTMTNLILRFDADNETVKSRSLIVQQAYRCLGLTQIRQFFSNRFGTQAGSKLWSKLNFIARPLVDCRLLRSIVAREPQLQNCKISLVLFKSKTTPEAKDVVGIFEAWERLGLGSTPEPVIRILHRFSQRFEMACAETFSLHAEMQLVMHYEERCAPRPTLDYFGCSKKTCLLCETFLRALPSSIATRGRHGVCYPAWAVPDSNSGAVKVAVKLLEKSLLSRIRGILNDLMHPCQKSLAANVMQSGMVSDFSHLTLEEWQQREQDVQLFKNEQTIQHNDLMIIGCEKSDFPSHNLLCEQFAIQPDRPSPEHKRAIFFPVEGDKPCLIWIPCRRQYDEADGIGWTQIDSYPYLGTDDPFKGTMRIEHNPVRGRNLGSGFAGFAPYQEGFCVSLIHRDAYLKDGSAINRSILASVRASCTSIIPHEYRGPMVALREIRHEAYADITLADFRHLMDYLISYRNTHVRESVPDLLHRTPTTFRGVKICCHGEVKFHGSEPFVSVDVTRANRISLGSGSISPISVCLGMPIRFWKDTDTEFRHNPPGREGDTTADSNPNVAFMMMVTDPSKDEWGWVPMYWNSNIGNVWAVCEDGRDLAVKDVAMMCHFARRKLQCMFEDLMESDSSLFASGIKYR
ncbi:hypothetical protein N7522_004402 [Penicillium canescens]|nr:hypothetical protein N7522_004402 [Penicillium canescens]